MRNDIGRIGAAALCCALAALPAVAQSTAARTAIEEMNKAFTAALARGDAAALAAVYAADAKVFPPNSEVVTGAPAIQKLWQAVMDSGVKGATLTTGDVVTQGNTAYEDGTYEMKGADGKTLDRGKYVVVWKREAGRWKIHRDIWNTSQPPAPAR